MVWITWLCSSVVCFLNLNVLVAVSKGMQAVKLSSVKKLSYVGLPTNTDTAV